MDITLLCVLVGPSFDVSGDQKAALNWPEMFNPDWVWVFRRYWHKAPRPHAWEMRPVFRAPLAIVQTSPSVASQTRGLMLALSKFECWLYESHKFVWVTSILVVTRFLRHSGIPFWPMNSCIILEDLGWMKLCDWRDQLWFTSHDFVWSTRDSPVRHRGFGEVLRTMKSVFGKEGKLLGLSIEMLTVVFFRVLDTWT